MRHRRHARINIFSAWTIKLWQEPQTSSVSKACRLASRQIAPWSLWYVFHKNHIYLINIYYLYMYKWSLPMYILYLSTIFMSLHKVLCELWSDKLCVIWTRGIIRKSEFLMLLLDSKILSAPVFCAIFVLEPLQYNVLTKKCSTSFYYFRVGKLWRF